MSDEMHDKYMLTTVDNPFNPFVDFIRWMNFDEAHGYGTTGFLARIVKTSDELSEIDQDLAIEDGIDEIMRENVSGMYRKVSSESWPEPAGAQRIRNSSSLLRGMSDS